MVLQGVLPPSPFTGEPPPPFQQWPPTVVHPWDARPLPPIFWTGLDAGCAPTPFLDAGWFTLGTPDAERAAGTTSCQS